MVYGMHTEDRGRGVPCAVVVQYNCNSVGITGGGEQCNEEWLVHKSVRYPLSIAKSPCTSRSLGEVASSSSGQQAREQKRSAGRLLGDDDFDY